MVNSVMPVTVGPLIHFRNVEKQLSGEKFVKDTIFYKEMKTAYSQMTDDLEQTVINYKG